MTICKLLQQYVQEKLSVFVLGSFLTISGCSFHKSYPAYGMRNTECKESIRMRGNYDFLTAQTAIEQINTPREVADYIRWLDQQKKDEGNGEVYSLTRALKEKTFDCTEAAYVAAALLSDDGYQPISLILLNVFYYARHMVFVYKQDNLFGSIGINDFDCNEPRFKTVNDLAKYIAQECEEIGYPCNKYILFDMGEGEESFITTDKNMSRFIDILSVKEIK